MDALDQLSCAVHDDLERPADLLERLGQRVPASACHLSHWHWQPHADSILSGLVLPEAAGAVSRDAGARLSLLLYVDLRVERDRLRVVLNPVGRVAAAGSGAAQCTRCDPGDVGRFAPAQGIARA